MNKFIVLIWIMFISIFSCNLGTNSSMSSGTIYDDDIEEPITDSAKKYEYNLNVSNAIIDSLKVKNYKTIYNDIFSDELKKRITFENYSQMMDNAFKQVGPIISYKKLQWNFKFTSEEGRNLLSSIKIVHHKNTTLYYTFVFDKDNSKTIVGFHFNEKTLKK